MKLKNYDGAVDDYNSSLFANLEHIETYAYRGLAEAMTGDTASMNADFAYAAKINPKDDITYVKRGAAKLYFKDVNGAVNDLNTAITLNPKSDEAYMRRGMAKLAQNNKAAACTDLNKAVGLGSREAPELVSEYCK